MADRDSVRFGCAWCGLAIAAPADAAGRGRCPHYGQVQTVPRSKAGTPTPYALVEEPPTQQPSAKPAAVDPIRARELWASVLHESAGRDSVLAAEIVALVLLSLADLMTTYHLLRTHPQVYESNPIAQYVFSHWNIAGMAVYKFTLIGFVVVVGEVVERRRPGLGRFVILIGCLATGLVTIHGLRLAIGDLASE